MKFIAAISFLFTFFTAFAQRQNVYYLKNNGKHVSDRDSADFIRIVREPDSGSLAYNVLDYYKNGKPMLVGKSLKIDPVRLELSCIRFFPNGRRKSIATYDTGLMIGQAFEYYPNGKLYLIKDYGNPFAKKPFSNNIYSIKYCADSTGKAWVADSNGYFRQFDEEFKNIIEEGPIKNGKRDSIWKGTDSMRKLTFVESYENGLLKTGTATDSLGVTSTYQIRSEETSFKGGIEAFYNFMAKTIRYPAFAREHNIQGVVYVSFYVQKDGTVANVKILKSPDPDLSNESIRLIKASFPWALGQHYGRYDSGEMTLPITFTIREQ